MKRGVLTDNDVEDYYEYDDYAGELAYRMSEEGKPVYTLSHNGGKAFADITEKPDTLFINYLASTGKGSGTELLAQLSERASSKGLSLEWVADEKSAQQYYEHIGVQKYGTAKRVGRLVNVRYTIRPDKLNEFSSHLRTRKGGV